MRQRNTKKPHKTSKLALVFLLMLGLGTSWYLFNSFTIETWPPNLNNKYTLCLIKSQNTIFQKTKSSAYNLSSNLISIIKKKNPLENIQKNEPALIWCRLQELPVNEETQTVNFGEHTVPQEQCYLINTYGIAYKTANMQYENLIKIHETVYQPITLNETFIEKKLIDFILTSKNLMPIIINIQPKDFFMPAISSNRLDIITSDNQCFILNTSKDLENQLILIKEALKKISRDDQQNLEYMGVDVDAQVYYKINK